MLEVPNRAQIRRSGREIRPGKGANAVSNFEVTPDQLRTSLGSTRQLIGRAARQLGTPVFSGRNRRSIMLRLLAPNRRTPRKA